MSAHISEHMVYKYCNEAQQLVGGRTSALGQNENGSTEEQEMQVAAQAAQAAAQITGKAQQQAVLEKQMAAAQDPVMQQQQAELQVK